MRTVGIRADGVHGPGAWRLAVAVVTLYAATLGTPLSAVAPYGAAQAGATCRTGDTANRKPGANDPAPVHGHVAASCCPPVTQPNPVCHAPVSVIQWPRSRVITRVQPVPSTLAIRDPSRDSARPRAPPSLDPIA